MSHVVPEEKAREFEYAGGRGGAQTEVCATVLGRAAAKGKSTGLKSLCGNSQTQIKFVWPALLRATLPNALRCLAGVALSDPRWQPWCATPQARQVQCGGYQSELRGYFCQPAHPEPPHPALLFQDSQNRFGQGFAPSIHRRPGRRTQLSSQAPMRWMTGMLFQPPAAIQNPGHVAVRHIPIDASFFQRLQVVQGEKTTVRTGLSRPLAALAFHLFHHGHQQARVIARRADLLRDDSMIVAYRYRRRIPQQESST